MNDLTQRQVEVLKSLIEEYIATAEPVGSETLEKKYSLSASPATIRNEMVGLTKLGYLKKTHTSSGRAPTPMGMKFYVKQLMKEKQLPLTAEVSIKEKLMSQKYKQERLLKEAVTALAQRLDMLGLAIDDDGLVYYAGAANILD